eukprot:PITA_32940
MRILKDIYDDLDVSSNFALLSFQPSSFEEAIRDGNWVQAMDEEIEAIENNDTWDLIDLPKYKNHIGVKWAYKTKLNEKGEIDRFKARLVAKGFLQQPGIYFGETFAPVARLDTVRVVLATTTQNKWKVYHMDVKSTFFNGTLEEEIYVRQLPGYEVEGDFELYEFKAAMMKEFEMKDLGLIKYFLGIEVEQFEKGIFICQNKYAKYLLKRFRMENFKHVPTTAATGTKLSKDDVGSDVNSTLFKRLVGSLMYLTATGPDIMQGVSLNSRFMETPKDTHWSAGKRILRCIAGTRDCGIMYARREKKDFIGYTNSDFAGSLDDRKSTYGYVFHLGSGAISWASK